jgi:hypothetical protein
MMVDIPQEQQTNVFSFVSGSLADLTAEIWARITLAKAAMSSVLVPNISLDNTQHITFKVQMDSVMLYELLGEYFLLQSGRKQSTQDSLAVFSRTLECSAEASSCSDNCTVDSSLNQIADMKGKGIVITEPECTSQVRRSSRSNKYDGFNHKNLSEARASKSKVKQRKVPAVKQKIQKSKKLPQNVVSQFDHSNLDATPIPVLQSIGVNLCGVPPEELAEGLLLAPPMPEVQITALEASKTKDAA